MWNVSGSKKQKFHSIQNGIIFMTQNEILTAVIDGTLFGIQECDVRVPADLREHIAEMLPVFKNALVTRDDIGPYTRQYAEEYNMLKNASRMLVGSYRGDKILHATRCCNGTLPTSSSLIAFIKSSSTKRIPASNALGSPSP